MTEAQIAAQYAQKARQITSSYNQEAQGLRNEENTLQNQMNQLKGQQQQDQNEISQDQQNINSVAKQEQDLSNTMSGSGSVGSQYQASLTKDEQQTGYNETAMQTATANQQQATGAISAYKDTLKTAWASNGQSNNVYQAQQQKVEQGLNSNVQSAGKSVQALQGAYEAATKEASQQAEAYYEGEQNQMTSYKNLSTTYQGLLTQSIQKYENDVSAYNNAASAYTIASEQYSFATKMYGYAIKENSMAEQEEVFTRITMPAIAAANYAMANKENAIANEINAFANTQQQRLNAARSTYAKQQQSLANQTYTVYSATGSKTFKGANAREEAHNYYER